MTLEQVIRILHPDTCTEALNEMDDEIDVRKIFDTACLLACKVMQREVERVKGCEFCDDGTYHDVLGNPCKYSFCPMCGKSLNDGKVDGDE